jgi:hypothetical protein
MLQLHILIGVLLNCPPIPREMNFAKFALARNLKYILLPTINVTLAISRFKFIRTVSDFLCSGTPFVLVLGLHAQRRVLRAMLPLSLRLSPIPHNYDIDIVKLLILLDRQFIHRTHHICIKEQMRA